MPTYLNCSLYVHVSGETVFLAAVYGPVEVKLQKIQIDRATVEATFRSSSGATCELHVVISSVYVVSTQTFGLSIIL